MSDVDNSPRIFLSVEDLALRDGVPPATVHAWLYRGDAPRSYKIGRHRRFKLVDVEKWEDSLCAEGNRDPQPRLPALRPDAGRTQPRAPQRPDTDRGGRP